MTIEEAKQKVIAEGWSKETMDVLYPVGSFFFSLTDGKFEDEFYEWGEWNHIAPGTWYREA